MKYIPKQVCNHQQTLNPYLKAKKMKYISEDPRASDVAMYSYRPGNSACPIATARIVQQRTRIRPRELQGTCENLGSCSIAIVSDLLGAY